MREHSQYQAHYEPPFENAIEEMQETDLPDCDIAKYAESCDTCRFCNGETKGDGR